jgi:hypothetical protein
MSDTSDIFHRSCTDRISLGFALPDRWY